MKSLLLSVLLFLPAVALAEVPMELTHQGRLFDSSGTALSGVEDITFTLFDAPSGGTEIWSETLTLNLSDDYFSTQLGADAIGNPLSDSYFDDNLWLQITVGAGSPLPTRLQLVSVPFARKAGSVSGGIVDASEIRVGGNTIIDGGGTVDASEIRVGGNTVINSDGAIDWTALDNVPSGLDSGENLGALNCTQAQIAVQGSSGWTCGDANDHSHAAEDIVEGTFTIDRLPIGNGDSHVAAGNHTHDFEQIAGEISTNQLPASVTASAVPSGMIAMFDAACPTGWSAYDALNGRIPRGEPTGNADSLDQGGSDDAVVVAHGHNTSGTAASGGGHAHSVSGNSGNQSANHTHGAGSFAAASAGAHAHGTTVGSHRHRVYAMPVDDRNITGTNGGGQQHGVTADAGSNNNNYTSAYGAYTSSESNTVTVNSGGAHGHSISGTSANQSANHNHAINITSATAGAHGHSVSGTAASTGVSATGANLPAYAEMIFCKKD